jgi:hypothetical protein
MKKYLRFIILGLVSMLLFAGCTKSNALKIKVDYKDVVAIELYDIDGKKVSEIPKEEYEKIIGYLNSSKISNEAHILIITGKVMKITFNDNSQMSFTSYGSATNCVVSGTYKGKEFNYHLISEGIAKTLLEK